MKHAIAIFVIVFVVSLNLACGVRIWNECRAAGQSLIYCWRMVSR
jgi:hypothetical protein